MMKRLLSFFLILLFASAHVNAQSSQESFFIYAPEGFSPEVLKDCAQLLSKATGKSWKIASTDKIQSGFILQIQNDPLFTSKESFRLQTDGSHFLTLSSSSMEGLVFGLYKHLRSLGFKFYLPDDLHTIIPSLTNPFGIKKNIVDKPFLQVRNFAGTGGLGSGNSDPERIVERDWNLWKLRNGFGSAYQLSGHRGENFILENKEKLRQHPEWLVLPLTGNPSDISIKLNYLNKDALDFYTDWTIQPFLQKSYKLPPAGHSDFVSIEPSDGGGYLNDLPQNARKNFPSVSDQVYGAANVAAKKLDKLFPDHPTIGVNMYAYASHAEPPSFSLHPRVFVQLIPYQFQNVAYGPSFIKLWSSKVKRFGVYDYLKYADAQFDVPGGITLEDVMKRLIQSVNAGSEGTTYETSFSKFSTGIMLWVMARYMTDGDINWTKNLSLLINDLYKKASPSITELFDLFYNNPLFDVNQLPHAAFLVQQASQTEKDAVVQNRLNELKEYLQFVSLVYQSRNEKNGSLKDRLLPIADYAWKIYDTKIIHSYRIMQLICFAFYNSDASAKEYAEYKKLYEDWFPETDRKKAAWGKFPQTISPQQIEKNFQLLNKNYVPSTPASSYTFPDVINSMGNQFKPQKKLVLGGDNLAHGYFGIYTDKATDVKIKYVLTGNSARLNISAVDKNLSNPLSFVLDKAAGDFKFSVAAGETNFFLYATNTTYRLQIEVDNGIFFFDGAPRGTMAFYKNFSDPVNLYTYDPPSYPAFIYFPQNITTIEYKVQVNALAITSPSGKQPATVLLQAQGGLENRRFFIDKLETGKLWKAVIGGNYNYNFLNIPDRYFLLSEKR